MIGADHTSGGAATATLALRKPELGSQEHAVRFYTAEQSLVDDLCRELAASLRAGKVCISLYSPERLELLDAGLRKLGVNPGASERYIAADAREMLATCLSNGQPSAACFNEQIHRLVGHAQEITADRQPDIIVFGEMAALLCAEGRHEIAWQVENIWNDLIREYRFNVRCSYPIGVFRRQADGESMGKICGEHTQVMPAEGYTTLSTDDARLRTIALLQQKAQALESEIEERQRMQETLIEMNHALMVAIAARDEFLSIAAHELKTPVTSLRGFTQLLLRDLRQAQETEPERLERALDAIERQTAKLNRLVSRLLDISQMEAGKLRIAPERTDLAMLTLSVLTQQFGDARSKIVYGGPTSLEAEIDPIRFEQVITNLVENAIKFSPEGSTVTVKLRRRTDGGIELSVTDQGVGIPHEEREAVFDRFYQAHAQRHLSGLGLGLHIAREIVTMHGGSIRIEDPEHQGTRFVVALPSRLPDERHGQ
ncbi:MAG TPA: ATP-binding protein [Thermomicrobiales bacterium]